MQLYYLRDRARMKPNSKGKLPSVWTKSGLKLDDKLIQFDKAVICKLCHYNGMVFAGSW